MKCTVAKGAAHEVEADWLVIGSFEGEPWQTPASQAIDDATGGLLSRLRNAGDITGKANELVSLAGLPGVRAERLLIVGLGKPSDSASGSFGRAARAAAKHISQKKRHRVAMALVMDSSPDLVRSVTAIVEAAIIGSHGQDLYKAERKRHAFDELVLVAPPSAPDAACNEAMGRGEIMGTSVNLVRDLINEPPHALTPTRFAARAESVARESGVRVTVFDEERIRQERMGALLGVAAGSSEPPRFLVLEYNGTSDPAAPRLALVGKGITFDSGGLSIKNTEQMEDMKCDMAGAATVVGTVRAIALLKLPVRVLGLTPLAENMPGPRAMKLGDVLTARNGKTIEILNTDAEGRLILADALSYAVDQGVNHIVDLATLTGSCVIALGKHVAGLMTNNQVWADRVRAAAERVDERMWQLPMFDDYGEQLQSGVADMKNIGTKWGGAITAAKFLENFVAGTPWVHLDIAGPAWADEESPTQDGGGTGAYVRSLVELAQNYAI